MSMRSFIVGIALAIQATPAAANGNPVHMVTTGRTSQPIGHYNYCKLYRSDCRIKSRDTIAPKLTRERWKELVEVNAYSNATVAPYTDQEIYNVEEHWTYPTSYGDCEDYVLMKRHMLMQRGWPPSSLLITVVRQPNGEGHAVLTVRTDRADYVLDNLDGKIRPWNKTPYTYLKRQDVKHSGRWADIRDTKSPSS
ncbi:MAG: transglutaminase-like cysteine peptidase [Pseudomonadota bacterium]